MTNALPPALANHPQFTPEYWRKVPRITSQGTIERVTNLPEEDGERWVEIVMKGGLAFRRQKHEIQQFLHANQVVHVENINHEIVTGLIVPDVGWAFRMTNEDLAEHTRKIAALMHERKRLARLQMTEVLAAAMQAEIDKQGHWPCGIDLDRLADVVLTTMEHPGGE